MYFCLCRFVTCGLNNIRIWSLHYEKSHEHWNLRSTNVRLRSGPALIAYKAARFDVPSEDIDLIHCSVRTENVHTSTTVTLPPDALQPVDALRRIVQFDAPTVVAYVSSRDRRVFKVNMHTFEVDAVIELMRYTTASTEKALDIADSASPVTSFCVTPS